MNDSASDNVLPRSIVARAMSPFSIDVSPQKLKSMPGMDNPIPESSDLVKNSVLYKEFLAEREEILKRKWIESEKAGHDIGFEKALLDWIVKHRSAWREKRQRMPSLHAESPS